MILNCKGMGAGFGDLITASWIPEVQFQATGSQAELLQILNREIVEDSGISNRVGWKADLKHGHEQPRLKSWCEVWGVEYDPVRPQHTIKQSDMKWARKEIGKDAVLIFPQTRVKSRSWATSYWIDLAWRLKSNWNPVVVLESKQTELCNVPKFYYGFGWSKVAAMIKTANFVIGVDSAPAHLAGTIGTPTIAICGPTTENAFAHVPEVRILKGTWSCQGCNFGEPYRAACDQGCMSMLGLTSDEVFAELQSSFGGDKF